MPVTLPYIFDILLIQGVLTLRYDNQGINVKYIRNFYPKADKWYFLSQVFRIVLIFPHISDYLINNRKCIQISIQSRMNSLRYENVINRLFKKLQGGCSFFLLSRHNAFWNGGKKSMKVRRRGDTEQCFYPWNGAACELMCIHSENKML